MLRCKERREANVAVREPTRHAVMADGYAVIMSAEALVVQPADLRIRPSADHRHFELELKAIRTPI
jgi:hypothetical protein